MKYYLIAGEASGDLHASNLIKAIKNKDKEAKFRGWGGDLMQQQGTELVSHIRDYSVMGFTEILKKLTKVLKSISLCKKDVFNTQPDVLILIDFPAFNLRIARFAKQHGIKVVYYISPQVWAWKESRVKKIKQCVDKMIVILPFEKDFYKKYDMEVEYVGHPLLDSIENYKSASKDFTEETISEKNEMPLIALLPGSRKQEIKRMLPLMLSVCSDFPRYRFAVACAPSIPISFYSEFTHNTGVQLIQNQTYSLLLKADAALVTSGTATLETALLNTPEIVCYKGSTISYLIARKLIKVKFISLVNLIMDEKVVEELIQHELNRNNLKHHLDLLLYNGKNAIIMKEKFEQLRIRLGNQGASQRAADVIADFLKSK